MQNISHRFHLNLILPILLVFCLIPSTAFAHGGAELLVSIAGYASCIMAVLAGLIFVIIAIVKFIKNKSFSIKAWSILVLLSIICVFLVPFLTAMVQHVELNDALHACFFFCLAWCGLFALLLLIYAVVYYIVKYISQKHAKVVNSQQNIIEQE